MERLAPMLAVAAREPFDAADYLFEVKWDGIRALNCRDEGGWRLWGRDGADYGPRYPELAVLAASPQGTTLDGEIVLLSQGLPDLAALLARHGRAPARHCPLVPQLPVTYVVFDALHERGPLFVEPAPDATAGVGAVLCRPSPRGDGPSPEVIPMSASSHPRPGSRPARRGLEGAFLALLPRIELHGHIYFRHLRPQRRADAIQEMRALGWKWFLNLHRAGKDPADFMMSFTTFLARAVNSGRRLAGMAKSRDVMNSRAQKRYGFKVEALPSVTRTSHDNLYATPKGQELHDALEARLGDNTITPVPDQVQFRIDFPAWLETLTPRERRMIRAMARNERTLDLSKEFEVSPSHISQMRREFQTGWERYISAAGSPVI